MNLSARVEKKSLTKIIINKDGNVLSYDFDMDDTYIYLDSNQKTKDNTSNKKIRTKNNKRI